MGFFLYSIASNSAVNCQSWLNFELVEDFMSALVILKYDDKYNSVFRENRCPPPPHQFYGRPQYVNILTDVNQEHRQGIHRINHNTCPLKILLRGINCSL